MADSKKPLTVKILQWIYLLVFIFVVGAIIVLHNVPNEMLVTLRVPRFLREIDPFLGYAWPSSLLVYQVTLLFSLFLILVDSLGLFFYQARLWRIFSDLSSFLGLFVAWTIILFFVFSLTFSNVLKDDNIQTAMIFLALSLFLFILDLVTFAVDEQSLGRRLFKKST